MRSLFSTPSRSIAVFPGGGTQGIISAYTAKALLERSGQSFHENFDQVEGLSVGALNAASLWPLEATGEPALGIDHLVDIYLNDIDGAFKSKFWALGGLVDNKYNIEGLTEVINKNFGDLKLSDFADGLHIYVVDVDTKRLRALRSEDAKKDPAEDFYMRDLLRAAVAAPFYFEPVEIKNMKGEPAHFVDGGLFSSDPAYKAYFDVTQELGHDAKIALTTFGTGHKNNEKISLSDLNGGLPKAGSMISTAFKSKANTFDFMLREAMGDNYVRIDVDLSDSGIGIVADNIRDVVPYAERAVSENRFNIERALENIRVIREEKQLKEEPAVSHSNAIQFPAIHPTLEYAGAA